MNVRYEWCIETSTDDEIADIIDLDHRDTFAEVKHALTETPPAGEVYDIVLIRDQGTEADGLIDRQWAYLKDGKLPSHFDGGAKVPARFHKEVAT